MSEIPGMKPKVVFLAAYISQSFMRHDIALMSAHVDVIPIELIKCSGFKHYTFFTRLLSVLIREQARVVMYYFVNPIHTLIVALMVRLMRRKLLIVTGGVDATYLPEIQWGAMGNRRNRFLFSLIMRLTDSVLVFSNSSGKELLKYGKPKRLQTAYMAVDTDTFIPNCHPKKRRAVTVCYSISQSTLIQKGIDQFVQAAADAPEIEFIVSGKIVDQTYEYLVSKATPNVHFTNRFLEKQEYVELLQSAQVYIQASAHEGFGVSLAEAMACECVPVVTDRYSLPEVAGGTGYIVAYKDPHALAQAVREAMNHPEKGSDARKWVVDHFTESKREKLLCEEIQYLLG